MLVFGDVFTHEDMNSVKEYVFLAEINSLTYAARILDSKQTTLLRQSSERSAIRRPSEDAVRLYCFVVLTTPGYENRAAHVGMSDRQTEFPWMDKVCALVAADIELLKKEIIESDGVPIVLKKYVKAAFNG